MTDSVWAGVSVVVGGEVSSGDAGLPVVPEAGGEGEQTLGDAGDQVGHRVGAVVFERELAFECVETPEVVAWLEAHPRWHFHFTPTHASWLNQIELFFSILSRRLP